MTRRSKGAVVSAQFLSVAAKFVTFIVLAQVGGIATAGLYTAGLAVVTPIFTLASMSLRNVYVTLPRVAFRSLALMRLCYCALGAAAASIIGVMLYADQLLLLAWLTAYKIAELLVDLATAHHQKRDKLVAMASNTIALGLCTNSALCLTFVATRQLVLSVAASAFAGLAVAVVALLSILLQAASKQQGFWGNLSLRETIASDWLRVSRAGLMLSIASSMVALSTSLPVIALGQTQSPVAVGLYSGIYYISTVSNILYSAIAQVELHTFANLAAAQKMQSFWVLGRQISARLSLVGLGGLLLIATAGVPLFSFMFGTDYSDQWLALTTMGLFIIVSPWGFIFDVQITALNGYGIQARIALLNLIVTCVAAFTLVPLLGVLGGTLTVLIALCIRILAKYAWLRSRRG